MTPTQIASPTPSMTGIYRTVVASPVSQFRHTKIVATLGPATDAPGNVAELVKAGMDVARLNFSHGTQEDHQARHDAVRATEIQCGRTVSVMADLCGPKIRLGPIADFEVRTGSIVDICDGSAGSHPNAIPVSLDRIAERVKPGNRLLVDDGRIRLRVVECLQSSITCIVEVGGIMKSRKGVNLPDSALDEACLTPKDLADLAFAVELGVDFVALSFVRRAEDISDLRARLRELGSDARVIAKIERPEAIANLSEIIAATDGVMVARGDLGVEMGAHEVPMLQKQIIDRARRAGKTVITATQMLETMVSESEPTRAEVSDVANAILDGTAAVMLSAETASGRYPIHAVEVMSKIAEHVESMESHGLRETEEAFVETALMHAACGIAAEVGARAIVVPTSGGSTPRDLSRFRPHEPIVATSADPRVVRQLTMEWGVFPVMIESRSSVEETWHESIQAARSAGWICSGDLVILSGRRSLEGDADASLLALHRVG